MAFAIWRTLGDKEAWKLLREKTWLGSALTAEAKTLSMPMKNSIARNAVWCWINFKNSKMHDDFQEGNDAVATYIRHRAEKDLAEKMDLLFRPLSYIPISNLDREVQKAFTPSDFCRVAFARLLRGETQQARRYLQGAFVLDPTTYGLAKIILDNLDEVQRIVTASRSDFNELRRKYGRRPF